MAAPSDLGKRLIPQILDKLALEDPDRIVYSVAKSADISKGLVPISARQFAKAVDKTAWWLDDHVGKSDSCQAIGYIGPHDLRHILLTYAAIKVGYAALFLSPKNSTEGALAVLEAADCNIWVHPVEQPRSANVQEFLQERPMRVLELPQLDDLLETATTDCYPYEKTFEEAAQDPFCILHTSGSTGLPKPTIWSHALVGTMDAVRLLPPVEGDLGMAAWTSDWNEGDTIYSSFPMSHGAGVIMDIMVPSLFAMHCVLGPVGVIPNMDLIESLVDYGKIDIWSMVPSLVDELGETPDVLVKFKSSSSKFICASGGPTSPMSASKVNKAIRVLNLTGTTEGLFIGNLWVNEEDWLYFAFHPYSGFEFREVEPGVYEHWIKRNQHSHLFQGIFTTFPDIQEYNFKDLYTKHPTKPDHWAYKGRSDDVVVLSNGYKIAPLETEAFVSTHPAVSACLIVGSGKTQGALLIELKDPILKNAELLDSIWSTVEIATASSLHKGQLHKEYIFFSDPSQPFVRTDKGTIKRRATLILYKDYIDRFYESKELEIDPEHMIDVDTSSIESIQNAVRHILSSLKPGFKDASPDTDFFNLGLDSLLVFRAIRSLRIVLRLKEKLAPRHLYANPTLAKFSVALAKLVGGSKSENGVESELDEKLAKMKELLGKYKSRQPLTLSGFDLIMPKLYPKLMIYIPLRKGISFQEAFVVLQRGLARTLSRVPALDGKVVMSSEQDAGYKPGQLQIVPPPSQNGHDGNTSLSPRQLVYSDLSDILPSFENLRRVGFTSIALKDKLFLDVPWFPSYPTDVIRAQANFVEGGCLLAAAFHHVCFDGTGVLTAFTAWAESCRYIQGDTSATCSWLDPDSMNRMLPHLIWQEESSARRVEEIDPRTWGYLGLPASEKVEKSLQSPESKIKPVELPPAKLDRHLETTTFSISAEAIERLMEEVATDLGAKEVVTSADILQALFWRALIRARYRVEKECHEKKFGSDDVSILELPIDARPYFSPSLPSSYMGNLVVINRSTMSVETLCSPETSIGRIALLIREAATRIRPSLVHDAYSLLQTVQDYTKMKYAFMRLDGLDMMITNLMLLPMSTLSFGGTIFENGGVPDTMMPLLDGFNSGFRLCFILPMREDGSVDFRFGVFPEELERLKVDEEFSRYATFLG